MYYVHCWLITPSIGWIGDSLYPAPSHRSILRWEVVVLPFILIKKARRFFFTFFVDASKRNGYKRRNNDAIFFLACMVCAKEKDCGPLRMEMDNGNYEKDNDKRNGE